MGSKKKRRQDEARIREAMARLVAAAQASGTTARSEASDPSEADQRRARRARTRGPQKAPTKEPISVRLDRDVVAELRASGRGWQTRLNGLLREALALDGGPKSDAS